MKKFMNRSLLIAFLLLAIASTSILTGCKKEEQKEILSQSTQQDSELAETETLDLEDGVYTVEFTTDSKMFHVNDVYENKAQLTVKDGKGTVHIVLPSKNIVNLFYGLAEDAQKDGAKLLNPTEETVTYEDGSTENVNAFDIPVPVLDEEFDVALLGKKGVWYDHKVTVSAPIEEKGLDALEDGEYKIAVTLEGGSGKATIDSPAKLVVSKGSYVLTVAWSSPHYDYMIVADTKYEPVNTDGNSVFEIPVASLNEPLQVIADTVAMSKPHEIEYVIRFDLASLEK